MKNVPYLIAILFALAGLQACSDKTVNAPAPAVVVPAPVAAAAPPPPVLVPEPVKSAAGPMERTASLQCEGRKIDLTATCTAEEDSRRLSCTRQVLTITDSATGNKLNTHETVGKGTPAVIEETFGEVSCVTTKSNDKFIVATMDNGGNCDTCEWVDVYSWDGALIGSERSKGPKSPGVAEATAAAFDKAKPPMATSSFGAIYFVPMEE